MEKELSIWDKSLLSVENGTKFDINLEKRDFKLDRKYIIKNGEFEGDLGAPIPENHEKMIEFIELLYEIYKHSIPSERSENKRFKYFSALNESELSDDDMMHNQERNYAQFWLEFYILCMIITGNFEWTDDMGKWFWQSKTDKDLVILKQWICGKA